MLDLCGESHSEFPSDLPGVSPGSNDSRTGRDMGLHQGPSAKGRSPAQRSAKLWGGVIRRPLMEKPWDWGKWQQWHIMTVKIPQAILRGNDNN